MDFFVDDHEVGVDYASFDGCYKLWDENNLLTTENLENESMKLFILASE